MATAELSKDLRAIKLELKARNNWSTALYGAETWTLQKVIGNNSEVLNCGAGEGWRRTVGTIERKMETYYIS